MKNFTKRTLSVIALGLIFSFCTGQTPSAWEWAKQFGGSGKDIGNGIITDIDGNSYITGCFENIGTFGSINVTSYGNSDVFIAKYNSKGECLWVKSAGGSGWDEGKGIAFDGKNSIYVAGYFSDVSDFGGLKVKSNGKKDIFIAKFTIDGQIQWVKSYGGDDDDIGAAVCLDKIGNIGLVGSYNNTVIISEGKFTSSGQSDILIAKLDSDGKVLFAKSAGGNLADIPTDINSDTKNNIIIAGYFMGVATFDTKRITSNGESDMFSAKYDEKGNLTWVIRGGGSTGNDMAQSLICDGKDNIYITGYFSGVADFGLKKLRATNKTNDFFLIKCDPTGQTLWAVQSEGQGDEHGRDLIFDSKGNIYLAGEFNATFVYGNTAMKNRLDWDTFVLKYDTEGKMIGGFNSSGEGYDRPSGIGCDKDNSLYVIGFFNKTITFDNTILKTSEEADGFIVKHKAF